MNIYLKDRVILILTNMRVQIFNKGRYQQKKTQREEIIARAYKHYYGGKAEGKHYKKKRKRRKI